MKKNTIITALLAMAGLALVNTNANAGTAPTSSVGDLFLALRTVDTTSGATTSTDDYLADLGSYTDFEAGGKFYNPGVAVNLDTTTNTEYGTDMGANWTTDVASASLGGSSWYTSGNTYYAVFGINTTGSGLSTKYYVFGTDNEGPATPWTQATNASNKNAWTDIVGIPGPDFNGATLAPNSNEGVLSSASNTNGYSYDQFGNGHSSANLAVLGQTLTGAQSDEALVNTAALALYYIPASGNGAEVELGTFNISSGGTLSFTAIPEPSTYAMVGIAIVFCVVWRMKRNSMVNPCGLIS